MRSSGLPCLPCGRTVRNPHAPLPSLGSGVQACEGDLPWPHPSSSCSLPRCGSVQPSSVENTPACLRTLPPKPTGEPTHARPGASITRHRIWTIAGFSALDCRTAIAADGRARSPGFQAPAWVRTAGRSSHRWQGGALRAVGSKAELWNQDLSSAQVLTLPCPNATGQKAEFDLEWSNLIVKK